MTSMTSATPADLAKATQRKPRRRSGRRRYVGLLFVAPALILVLCFFVIPLAMTAWMSLHNWPLLGKASFIGLGNYQALFTDGRFWSAMRFTVYYTVVVTIVIFAVAFPLALFVERQRPLAGFYRTVYFLPVVVGFGSASLLWAWLMNVDAGLFGPALQRLGITENRINILSNFDSTFWSIVAMVVWKTAGFTMIILMTGLQGIPSDLREAARIDGASRPQMFRSITFPLMRRTIALALILSVAGSMLAFDQFYIIANGGPRNTTLTAVYWIFNTSFVSFRMGYGAALSMVLLAILLAISVVQLRLLRTHEGI